MFDLYGESYRSMQIANRKKSPASPLLCHNYPSLVKGVVTYDSVNAPRQCKFFGQSLHSSSNMQGFPLDKIPIDMKLLINKSV